MSSAVIDREFVLSVGSDPPEWADLKEWGEVVTYAANRLERGIAHYERVIERIGFVDRNAALDVGCGPGHWCIALAGRNGQVEGIERLPEFVAVANRLVQRLGLGERTEFHVSTAEEAELGSEQFDVACCHSVLMFCDHERVLGNVARWLAGDGLFYCGYTTGQAHLAAAVEAIIAGRDGVAAGRLANFITGELYRCGLRRHRGNQMGCWTLPALLRACEWFGLEFVESPGVQDGRRSFLGEPTTIDFICRKSSDRRRSRSVAGADRVQQARELVDAGLPGEAIALLNPADAGQPGVAELLARARLKHGRPLDDAAGGELLSRVSEREKGLLTAMSSHVGGRLEEAVDGYQRLPEGDPDVAFLIATCLLVLKRYDEARTVVGQTPSSSPIRDWTVRAAAEVGLRGAAAARPLGVELVSLCESHGAPISETQSLSARLRSAAAR